MLEAMLNSEAVDDMVSAYRSYHVYLQFGVYYDLLQNSIQNKCL